MDTLLVVLIIILAVLVGLAILAFCFRSLRWILVHLARGVYCALVNIPAWLIGLAAIVACFFEPTVLAILFGIIRRLSILLAYDLPLAVFTAIGNLSRNCIGREIGLAECASIVFEPLSFFWTQSFGDFLFGIWPDAEALANLLQAIAIFVGVVMAGSLAIRFSRTAAEQRASGVSIARGAMLALAFLFSLYIVVTAIIATPFFVKDPSDTLEARADLRKEMEDTPVSITMFEKPDTIASNETLMVEIRRNGERLRPNLTIDNARTWLDEVLDGFEREVELLSGEAENHSTQTEKFSETAERYQRTLISHFDWANRGRLGKEQTDNHSDALAAHYRDWLNDQNTTARRCGEEITRASQSLEARLKLARTQLTATDKEGNPRSPNDTVFDMFKSFLAQSADSERVSVSAFLHTRRAVEAAPRTTLRPAGLAQGCKFDAVAGRDIPGRQNIHDRLGIFGIAAGWLLKTESPNLALITGMIGFGLFGALSASFIRGASIDERGFPRVPSNSELAGVVIRGVSATILTFLVVVGGLAVFSKGDLEPNAYAVFFACFVAAVFSEDVWNWAREQQRRRLAQTQENDASPEPPVGKGPAAPPG